MKQLVAIVCVGLVGFANAQSTSKDVEVYERYENGELVEQRQSATENGKPIENFDFEEMKRKMLAKSAEMDTKLKEMEARMKERSAKMSLDMDKRMKQMEQRMADMEKRSEEMHQRMDQRMKEVESQSEEKADAQPKQTPLPQEEPVQMKNTGNLKFT